MVEFAGVSGVKVVISPASFEEASTLKNAIATKIKLSNFKLDIFNNKNIAEAFKEINAIPFIELLLSIDSDKEVNAALFACLNRCTYGGAKIVKTTFDDITAREDYYVIIAECVKVNLLPFYKGLISRLSELGSLLKQNPPSTI